MKDATEPQPLHLRVLVFFGRTKWVAQCIEYDIAVQAENSEDLESRFNSALEAERQLSQKMGQEPLRRLPPAPRRYREAWDKALARQQREREKAEPWRNIPPFIAGVESIRVQVTAH